MRADIRSSFAGLSGTAAGVPLVVELTLVSAAACNVGWWATAPCPTR